MKLLITGGAGFMGSNFVHYILKKYPDYQIVNLDKLTYAGNLDNLRDVEKNPNYTFVKGDITDEALVDKLFQERKFDTVINYAAETHVDRSITGPRDFVITDVVGTCTLLEATKKYNVKRYIQISTDEVYGSIENGSFNEISPFMPNSPYSASKAGADHLCRAYFITYNLPIIVTHSCNVFGPYQYPEKVIPLFITNLMRGLKVPLYGDGKNVREWIYVEDHCIAIDEIMHKGKIGEVYNIGTGNEIQNIDLTKMVFEKMGTSENQIEYVKDRLGHDRRYSVDFSKLKNELGWTPKFSFSEALSETINWYKKNESWWKKLI
ncbi:MAG: dTDP-glucose 4,6-dehydratase, dTDP-glucose 4,6-dehydratase [Candidatus Peregrinibacteria bacterium GW2011_GWC2_39_14]|nr:MAG: dTDP-glucose 4,6-dehydratase [Candidatus Peregrinibacteria bacterium GW2011_GWA2_38_36]KKR07067.1 MAG: dTDP-glucose 4,6-dehydratase, dTDP-glucose 4,6-dehydratase [Candidatus Peregrinibacteria bacterium GW2011_GWC2_39_14]